MLCVVCCVLYDVIVGICCVLYVVYCIIALTITPIHKSVSKAWKRSVDTMLCNSIDGGERNSYNREMLSKRRDANKVSGAAGN